jgi:hypothetical protein
MQFDQLKRRDFIRFSAARPSRGRSRRGRSRLRSVSVISPQPPTLTFSRHCSAGFATSATSKVRTLQSNTVIGQTPSGYVDGSSRCIAPVLACHIFASLWP